MRALILVFFMFVSPAAVAESGGWAIPGPPGAIAVSYPNDLAASDNDLWEVCRGRPSADTIAACTQIIERGGLLRTRRLATAYYLRGQALFLLGENSTAISDFSRAIRLSPRMGLAYMLRGSAFAIDGDLDAALADLTNAISILPDNAQVQLDRGRVYLAKGDLVRASRDIDRAIELDPMSAEALAMRGAIKEYQGRPREALADFDAALAIDPDLPMALHGHARLAPMVQ